LPIIFAVAVTAVVYTVRLIAGGQNPAEAKRLHGEALALEKAGRGEDALTRMREAVAYDPQSIVVNRDYQRLMRKAGKLDQIRDEYRKRAANLPKSADAQYLAARIEEGDALETGMKRALAIDAEHAWAHQALGAYYDALKRTDDAARHFERAALSRRAEPDHARTYIAFLYANQRYDAIDSLLIAWEKQPPAFGRTDLEIDVPLGRRADRSAIQMQIALHREAPYLYGIRVVRADGSFRQIMVRRGEAAFVVSWSRAWAQPNQETQETESWQRPERPPFAEMHSAAMSRLLAEENQ